MILLNNYSQYNTFIQIGKDGYNVIPSKKASKSEDGIGGFSENNDLLGLYINHGKLYFQYNSSKYEITPSEIFCSINNDNSGNNIFEVKIKNKEICKIIYKPYINPLGLAFGESGDEFDFLSCLKNVLKDEESVNKFIKGIAHMKQLYLQEAQ